MNTLEIKAGEITTLEHSIALTALNLQDGAVLRASKGKSLTLVVDGTVRDLLPGSYTGKIELSVSDEHMLHYASGGQDRDYYYRNAVHIADGRYCPELSVTAAVQSGTVTNVNAKNVVINACADDFGGFYITGKTNYHIDNADITLKGGGGNDFIGFGAAITTDENAHLTIDNSKILCEGLSRSGLVTMGHSVVTVNNTAIEVRDGDPSAPGGVPWMLGLTGKVRATNLEGYSYVTYNNCHIKAQGWGAMSTDAGTVMTLVMNNCTVETTDDGYGCYSIGVCHTIFSGCTFHVKAIGTVMAIEGSATFTNGTVVNSGRIGIMMHHLGASGTLIINQNSVVHAADTGIQIKGRGAYIIVDGGILESESGLLLHTVNDDDPMAIGGPGMPPTEGQPDMEILPEDVPHSVGDDPEHELCLGDGPANHEVVAAFRNTSLVGDMLHTRTHKGNLSVTFENTSITGGISTGHSEHIGPNATPEHPEYIGVFSKEFCENDDPFGVQVSLDSGSSWTVTKTCYLTRLSIESSCRLTAPEGRTVTLLVNGQPVKILPGVYEGKLTLVVS